MIMAAPFYEKTNNILALWSLKGPCFEIVCYFPPNERIYNQCCGTGTGTVGTVTFLIVEPEPEP